jgi:hypothetical protein
MPARHQLFSLLASASGSCHSRFGPTRLGGLLQAGVRSRLLGTLSTSSTSSSSKVAADQNVWSSANGVEEDTGANNLCAAKTGACPLIARWLMR